MIVNSLRFISELTPCVLGIEMDVIIVFIIKKSRISPVVLYFLRL